LSVFDAGIWLAPAPYSVGFYNPAMTQPLDICIRGGGIVGHTLALLLARARLRVGLVTHPVRTPPEAPDVRAYALNAASKALLDSLRCWPEAQHATEVLAMQVKGDGGGEVNFAASDVNVPGLTWIVDVPVLEAQLREAVRFQPLIERLDAPQDATLTVVCEGKASSTRAEFGVEFDVTPYPQTALATRVRGFTAHGQVARQWFSGGEVLAFLPLDGPLGHEVAVVWSVPHARATALLAMQADEFCQALSHACEGALGEIQTSSARSAWPLQSALAQQWTGLHQGRAWALAGDAAHNVHPLAGQGLNLGLADAQALAHVLQAREYWRSVGDEKLLRRYARARKVEVWAMGTALDGLQQLFSQTQAPWQNLRNWGMRGFERSGPLKQWVTRQAMGLSQSVN
jgi:2-polyprenyl-6-methoxyphenol hydroxylase-like FAD-dependent oxidoreductase